MRKILNLYGKYTKWLTVPFIIYCLIYFVAATGTIRQAYEYQTGVYVERIYVEGPQNLIYLSYGFLILIIFLFRRRDWETKDSSFTSILGELTFPIWVHLLIFGWTFMWLKIYDSRLLYGEVVDKSSLLLGVASFVWFWQGLEAVVFIRYPRLAVYGAHIALIVFGPGVMAFATLVGMDLIPIPIWMLVTCYFLLGLGLWLWGIFSLYRSKQFDNTSHSL